MHAIELLGTKVAPLVRKELGSQVKPMAEPSEVLQQSVAG
jgi:hypothetical protein